MLDLWYIRTPKTTYALRVRSRPRPVGIWKHRSKVARKNASRNENSGQIWVKPHREVEGRQPELGKDHLGRCRPRLARCWQNVAHIPRNCATLVPEQRTNVDQSEHNIRRSAPEFGRAEANGLTRHCPTPTSCGPKRAQACSNHARSWWQEAQPRSKRAGLGGAKSARDTEEHLQLLI